MCEVVRFPDGSTPIVCGGHARRRRPCVHCGGRGEKLCDHTNSDGRTCDAPLCARCALSVPGRNRDYCRNHAPYHRAEVPACLPFEEVQ